MVNINNIDGIENASVEELKNLGNDAYKEMKNLYSKPITSKIDFKNRIDWILKVALRCTMILKEKGEYTEDKAGEVYRKFLYYKPSK